jgi:hypothetical protein
MLCAVLCCREVLQHPWYVQEVTAGVLSLKLAFDYKAGIVGLSPIPLESAVIAFHYLRWFVACLSQIIKCC